MNQRFQNAEIKLVSERYADNELYKAVNKIGAQLESELTEFGLCPEECFMEAVEMLSVIADKGKDVLPDLENLWLRKYNEYGRFDRSVDKDEIRKAIGIVLGFVILAVDSSTHPFYRRTLTEEITVLIANHKFEGWAKTLFQIASVPLPDGWFDAYIDEDPDEENEVADFANGVAAIRNQLPYCNLIVQLVSNQYNNSCQQFMGKMEHPKFIVPQHNEAV